jgi:tRNA threonylcarbamoyl adenosine modification protein YeaZ
MSDGSRQRVGEADGHRPWLLAIDTATSRVVVAAGSLDGSLLGSTSWEAGRTHGQQLLPAIGRLHGEANLRRSLIRGVIVGTGPGGFTGLRVGIATAKAIAHELGVPIVGVSTAEALLAGADATAAAHGETLVLLLPAGPNDRHIVRPGRPAELVPAAAEPEIRPGETAIAVDLDGRAPEDAVARGEAARNGLAESLVRIGARRLREGQADDLATLVPEYVTLPRGVAAASGEVAWSRDPR